MIKRGSPAYNRRLGLLAELLAVWVGWDWLMLAVNMRREREAAERAEKIAHAILDPLVEQREREAAAGEQQREQQA